MILGLTGEGGIREGPWYLRIAPRSIRQRVFKLWILRDIHKARETMTESANNMKRCNMRREVRRAKGKVEMATARFKMWPRSIL